MSDYDLKSVAKALVAEGKGILAADESSGTIKKRLASVNLESTEETRREYRELLFTSPEIENYISGVILFDETIRQGTRDGLPFPKLLFNRGIIPGIKVDKGAKDLPFFPGEEITEGLDGLRERLVEYRDLGAKFAKWRAVINIGENIPTAYCLEANSQALARYAALSQETGLVPIVEPEVIMDGNHSIERSAEVTEATLSRVFYDLLAAKVVLEGILLKPNMVLSGYEAPRQAGTQEVAESTLAVLRRVVPAAVPGIVFLSGGQTPEQATENLNAINALGPHPWQISFSYGRALQDYSIKAWRGDQSKIKAAQGLFTFRAKANSAARYGRYSKEMEVETAHLIHS